MKYPIEKDIEDAIKAKTYDANQCIYIEKLTMFNTWLAQFQHKGITFFIEAPTLENLLEKAKNWSPEGIQVSLYDIQATLVIS